MKIHSFVIVTVCAAACVAGRPAMAIEELRSPLHGALARGPHDVGFTRIAMADPTRPSPPARDGSERPGGDRSRKLDVHMW